MVNLYSGIVVKMLRDNMRFLFFIAFVYCSIPVQSQHGLKAEYYDGTNFNRLEAVKYVSNIDQNWYDQPPVPGINPFECSIRWTGKLVTEKAGTYTFSAQVDDGIRVWIDGHLIIDQWDLNDVGIFKGTTELVANKQYDLKVEYFNGMLEGEVRLLWKMNKEELSWYERLFGDGVEFSVIPKANFLSPEEPIEIEEKTPVTPPKPPNKIPTKKKPKVIQVKKETVVPKPKKTTTILPSKEVKKAEKSDPIVNAKVAEKFIPKNVQFEKGKTIILESSYLALDAFIQFLLDHPQLNVIVEGHTDVVGDPEMNLQLSKERAKVISDYLSEKGVAKSRIKSEGFGGSRPLLVPAKGKYHAPNRRVVFILDGF